MAEQVSARDSVKDLFIQAGLGDDFVNQLMGIIDGVYMDNLTPTDSEILSAVYASEPYKQRFAGNELIRKRLADGKGMPGDRILSPAEYINLEKTYRDSFMEAGLPSGFYDSPQDFANMIGSGVSAVEVNARVQTAAQALMGADRNTVNMLQNYYGLSTGDMVAYLLDPTKASEALIGRSNTAANLQSVFTSAAVGGAAANQGVTASKSLSEEIVQAGKAGSAESAFAQVGASQGDYARLSGIFGEQGSSDDLTRAALQLEGGATARKKIQKVSQKERSAFSSQSALGESSLKRQMDL
jgi:hypothetical protein